MPEENTAQAPADAATQTAAPAIDATPVEPAAPAVDTSTPPSGVQMSQIDWDSVTPEEREFVIANRGELPPSLREKFGEQAADPNTTVTTVAPATPEPKKDDSPPAVPVAVEEVEKFAFTPDADAETLAAEEAKYLELVEITPQLQAMLDRRDQAIEALSASVADVAEPVVQSDLVETHMKAFETLATYKEIEPGVFEPNTDGIVKLLEEYYPEELKTVIMDVNSQPSPKYKDHTRLMEMLRDGFSLSEQSIGVLQDFLQNGGRFNHGDIIPENLDRRLKDAYWTSPDRDAIDSRLEEANFTLKNESATQAEKAAAMQDIQAIAHQLGRIQAGIDAEKRATQDIEAAKTASRVAIETEAMTQYVTTALSLRAEVMKEIAAEMTMFDPVAAGIASNGVAVLIENALSDQDEFARAAQADLKKQGIAFDWKKGRTALDNLIAVEKKIAWEARVNAKPVIRERSANEKREALNAIRKLQKELVGTITSKLVKGAGAALQQKVEAAPKVPAVRPLAKGAGISPDGAMPDYEAMTPEQRRAEIERMEREAGAHGIRLRS